VTSVPRQKFAAVRPPDRTGPPAAPAGLTVVSTARVPGPDRSAPPLLPGFIVSSFSPLVAAVADQCLRQWQSEPPLAAALGERTALILASVRGDLAIAHEIAQTVDSGRRMPPLLFFQCVANAVLGHVASRWGIAGPMVCVSPVGDPTADAMALAAALIENREADAALVLVAEQAWVAGESDHADAVFVLYEAEERC
jgi:3-oxoacyl-(acyl-carrier-protein) synthase